jgi:hypothetical protein
VELEEKLAYLAKHTLPDHLPLIDPGADDIGNSRSFVNIGSLYRDQFLDQDDVKVATVALSLSPIDLRDTDPDELSHVLQASERLAHVIRARVFQKLVQKWLKAKGWTIRRSRGLRWSVETPEEQELVLVPVFGAPKSDLVDRRRRSLIDDEATPALIVVPHRRRGCVQVGDLDASAAVVVTCLAHVADAARVLTSRATAHAEQPV